MSGILGQLNPSAGVWEDLYTCPVDTIATLRVIVSNRDAVATTFRVAASKDGDAIADEHHLATDKNIDGNDTGSTIGFVISSGDVVRVWATGATLSFTATGHTRAE